MKKIILSALIIMASSAIYSQEMDEAYLNSLPVEVREDILKNIDTKEELNKPNYRSASSRIDKGEGGDDVFGKSFFDTIQSSFMPINEPNFEGTYMLDFGDVLDIQLIGQKNSNDSYQIKRDGSIYVADVGKIYLSGLSLSEASSLIKIKIANAYIGVKSFISLTNIRDISILIAGNAYNPGIYTLNGNSNMLHALSMAGGIDSIGSYRTIDLIRNEEIIDTLDVYGAMFFGKSSFKRGLRSGDTIIVRSVGKIVSVESGVLRPGKYELKDGENLKDLLNYSNGLNPNADKDNFYIKRTSRGTSQMVKVDFDDLESINIEDNDSIFIKEFRLNSVKILGAVKNPGNYKLPLGTSLSELILLTGGYEDTAYPFAGYFSNQKALKINTDAKIKLYNTFINNLISNPVSANSDDNNSGLGLVLQQIKDAPVTGRIIAEFNLELIQNNRALDTTLEDGDEIFIPSISNQVYVQGEVSNPGAIRYSPLSDITYYLESSGGALDSADLNTIFIVHPNGETQQLKRNSRLSFISAENKETLIYPGSIIYIPKTSKLASRAQVASIWAPIISSVALSLTSLSVLNNSN